MSEFMKIRYDLLEPNPYSRPQRRLENKKGIVVHWVANPMSTDYENKEFFNNRQYGKDGYGSAHEIIDLDGSILIVIPDDEMAYHVGSNSYVDGILDRLNTSYPNNCLYGIEFTHPDWTGEPNPITRKALVYRLAELCDEWNLDPIEDIYRHYDITGKNCPKYYVDNEDEFIELKREVKSLMDKHENHPTYSKWQLDQGAKAIDELFDDEIIDTPDTHKDILVNGSVPPWIVYTILSRIRDNIDEKIDEALEDLEVELKWK